ncbi:MAG: S-layer homology domain-containing protein, partial [Clostridia bacterium]|nr:S-layer homology domain-containing protein [Clostridia bacterium]
MKKVLFMLFVALTFALSANAAFERVYTYNDNFSDVADTAWYAENVKTSYELGFMNGKGENTFDPDGSVTVAEAIALASRLHASYHSVTIPEKELVGQECRFDFDDESIFVDLTERNSRNDNGVSLKRATGGVKDGLLVVQAEGVNAHGNYDPQITFAGLDLDTRVYNKLKIRMKRDELPNLNPDSKMAEVLEIFFETSSYNSISSDKCVKFDLKNIDNLSDWFEVEIDLSKHEKYVDYLTGLRLDPTNNNGIYYIDYVTFFSDVKNVKTEWYEMYHSYAIENGIVEKDLYVKSDMSKPITRRELCDLISAALPEEYYNAINDIKGIPDISRDEKNAEVYLMLYKAGVLLGSDAEGNFRSDANIKRSEVAAIINRAALPENRVRGNIFADWTLNRGEYDFEFDDPALAGTLTYEAESFEIKNGAIYMKALDRGEGRKPRFDPKISFKNVSINADEYTRIKIRMKAEFIGEEGTRNFDFFFMTEGDTNFSSEKGIHQDFGEYCYKDPAGWYVMEIDTRLHRLWSGTIMGFRFDPANTNGNFIIDYIRFIKDDYNKLSSHEELINAGYTATRLFKDETFENGFYVNQFEQKELNTHGRHD